MDRFNRQMIPFGHIRIQKRLIPVICKMMLKVFVARILISYTPWHSEEISYLC